MDLDFGFGTKTKKQLEKVQEGFKVDPTTKLHSTKSRDVGLGIPRVKATRRVNFYNGC